MGTLRKREREGVLVIGWWCREWYRGRWWRRKNKMGAMEDDRLKYESKESWGEGGSGGVVVE